MGVIAAATAHAAEPEPPKTDFAALSNDELWAAYEAAAERRETDHCGFYLPLLLQLETRGGQDASVSISRSGAELQCALEQKQWDVAYRQLEYLEGAGRTLPPLYTIAITQLAGALDDSAARLLAHIDTLEAGTAFEFESKQLWALHRAFDEAERSTEGLQFLRDLASESRQAKLPDDDRRAVLSALFVAEAEAGNMAAAARLIGDVRSPYTMLAALRDRRYASLWPQLEARAGENLHLILNAEVAEARTAFDAAPDNRDRLQELAHAYLRAGRFDEVVALVETRRPARSRFLAMEEPMAWALNVEAYALDALGRHDEAEAIFDQLAAIPFDPTKNGWLVSFVINRSSRLVDLGHFDKGLAAAEYAAGIADKSGSGYARMLVRRDRICALAGLGRTAEIAPILQDATTHADEAPRVAAEALLCAKDEDRAAALVIAGLNDPNKADQIAEGLHKPEFELFYNQSVLPSLAAHIRPRPDVDAAFRKVARDIPERFAPLFGKRRSELASQKIAAN